MNIKKGSYATPLIIRLALEGENQYIKIPDIPKNYAIPEPQTVKYWLAARKKSTGSTLEINWDEKNSTDDYICFILPHTMFVSMDHYDCVLRMRIDGRADSALDDFMINVTS